MAEVEVLLEKIAVDVVELHEAEAGRLVAGIEKAEMAAVGDQVAGAAGKVGERIVEQIEAADEARRAALFSMQHVRVRYRELAVVLSEARHHLTLPEDTVILEEMIEEQAGGPRCGVREEGALQVELLLVAIRVVRIERVEIPIRAKQGRMDELNCLGASLHAMVE